MTQEKNLSSFRHSQKSQDSIEISLYESSLSTGMELSFVVKLYGKVIIFPGN